MVSTQISATSGVANVTQTRSVKKTSKAEDIAFDFGQMMNQSLNDLGQQKTPDFSDSATKDMSFGAKSAAGASKIKNASDSKPQKTEKNQKADKEPKQTEEAALENNKVENTQQDAGSGETVEDADALRDKIKEVLGVTDEQIDEALGALQFSMEDLLDGDKMTQFVVQVTGNENALDLLTDNALSQGLFELQNFAAQIAEEAKPVEDDVKKPVLAEDLPQEAVKPVLEEKKEEDVSFVKASKDFKAEEPVQGETQQKTLEVTVTDNRTDSKNQTSADSGRKEHSTGEHNAQVFVSNLGNAVENAMSVAQAQGVDSYTAVSIVNQIVEAARVTLTDQVSTMELMLNPENLGKVALSVSLKEGVVTAQIVAENQNAKEAIESQVVMLKEQLNNQGLKVEAVEVTIASHSFEAGYDQASKDEAQAQGNKKKGNTRQIDISQLTDEAINELDEEERITAQMMADEGNMVNYQA